MNAAVALCHEWLTTFGGSDQVACRLAQVLHISQVFTYVAWEDTAAQLFADRRVTTVGPRSRFARRHWQWFLPHMPYAWRRVDLSTFDLVVTSSHATVNAVRPRDDAILVSYCHTPIRYAWEWRSESNRFPLVIRPLWPAAAALLRAADARRAQRVDLFLANSRFVARRIAAAYGKSSLVVYPPIDTGYWKPDSAVPREDFFLLSGRLVPYKRPEVVVEAAERAAVQLVVAGDGPMLRHLRKLAGRHVRFVLAPSRDELRDLYRRARAYVFAGVEDFGMSMVEAQACGTRVIAFAAGGALETVKSGGSGSGILVRESTSAAFAEALRRFPADDYDHESVREVVLRFDTVRFDNAVKWAAERALDRDWATLAGHSAWVPANGAALH